MIILYSSGSYADYKKHGDKFAVGYSFSLGDGNVRAGKEKPRTNRLVIEYRVDSDITLVREKGGMFRIPPYAIYEVVTKTRDRLVFYVSRKKRVKTPISVTANKQVMDKIIQRKIWLLAYAMGISEEAFSELSRSIKTIKGDIIAGLDDVDATPMGVRKMLSVLIKVREVREKAWANAGETIYSKLEEVGKNEIDWVSTMLFSVLPVLSLIGTPKKTFIDGLLITGKWDGRTLKEWFAQVTAEDLRKIESGIRAGVSLGKTPSTIFKELFGEQGIIQTTKRAIETVVRSAVSFLTGQARNETYKQNANIFDYERYTAVLDSRTSALCRGLDGRIFKVGEGAIPPMHPNCRSIRIPVLKAASLSKMGLKDATEAVYLAEYTGKNSIDPVKSREDLPHGHKTSFDDYAKQRVLDAIGGAPQIKSYGEWLSGQPQSFVEGILGVQRARLFMDGGLPLDKHVSFTGNIYTIDELNKKTNM